MECYLKHQDKLCRREKSCTLCGQWMLCLAEQCGGRCLAQRLTHSSGTVLQTPTAQDCTARHSWISTAGWQLQLLLETEREREGLCHTNVRKIISAAGRHEEEGILNTRDLTRLIGLAKILLPLASLSFSHHRCSKLKWRVWLGNPQIAWEILQQNCSASCALSTSLPSSKNLWGSRSDAFTPGLY